MALSSNSNSPGGLPGLPLTDLPVVYGQSAHRWLEGGFWTVSYLQTAGGGLRHLVTLTTGYPPGEDVRGVAWGLAPVDSPGSVTHAGRTDRRGQFWLDGLEPGEYRARYVTRVHDTADVDVLERLADAPARALLAAAVSDQSVLPLVRERAHKALARQAAIYSLVGRVRLPWTGAPAGRTALGEVHDGNGILDATIWRTGNDILTLEAKVAPGHQGDRLLRFTVLAGDGQAELAQGFLGLYETTPGGPVGRGGQPGCIR